MCTLNISNNLNMKILSLAKICVINTLLHRFLSGQKLQEVAFFKITPFTPNKQRQRCVILGMQGILLLILSSVQKKEKYMLRHPFDNFIFYRLFFFLTENRCATKSKFAVWSIVWVFFFLLFDYFVSLKRCKFFQ